MSDFLIHFTKGDGLEGAYQNLKNIIQVQMVYGANKNIRGDPKCVCFTEAPLPILKNGLLSPSYYSQYSPFGVITTKQHIFSLGGRHVIYQPEAEFCQLSDSNSWRHMRYEPPKADFTWEREWRLKTEGYEFQPENTQIIVPDNTWSQRLKDELSDDSEWQILQYSQIMDELLAIQYENPSQWIVIELDNT